MHQHTTPMSLGMISYDGLHKFYVEFTDFDQNQLDDWLKENVIDNFTLGHMAKNSFEQQGNSFFFKGDTDWVVNHKFGMKRWLKSFDTKIVCCSAGNSYDWILLRSLLHLKYKEDLPNYLDGWPFDIISIFRWEGFSPNGSDVFKENFLKQKKISSRHNALFDANVIREMYIKLEDLKKKRFD